MFKKWHILFLLIWAQAVALSNAQATDVQLRHINTQTAKPVAIFYSDQFLLHETGPNHPENPARLKAVIAQLHNNKTLATSLTWPAFKPATQHQLALVHTAAYLKLVDDETKLLEHNGLANLSTGDTVISPNTQAIAKLAVGAAIAASEQVVTQNASAAFAIVRPPGHHATPSRGMGFCVYNNVAIAARYLQKQHGIQRILIVDFDVHHGNGTQDIFYDDDSVFYFSVHQHPLYPGTGSPAEIGVGKGKGFTLNVALPAGAGDVALLNAINQQLKPAMERFKPEFILVSAGFDSHSNDPLGRLEYSDEGYAQAAKALADIANRYAAGRMVYVLEGGYDSNNIANSVEKIVEVLSNNVRATKP
jgi:acetoin utilization deacetylase AcuC-like enzyme